MILIANIKKIGLPYADNPIYFDFVYYRYLITVTVPIFSNGSS